MTDRNGLGGSDEFPRRDPSNCFLCGQPAVGMQIFDGRDSSVTFCVGTCEHHRDLIPDRMPVDQVVAAVLQSFPPPPSIDTLEGAVWRALTSLNTSSSLIHDAVNAADGGVVEIRLRFFRLRAGKQGIAMALTRARVVEAEFGVEQFVPDSAARKKAREAGPEGGP